MLVPRVQVSRLLLYVVILLCSVVDNSYTKCFTERKDSVLSSQNTSPSTLFSMPVSTGGSPSSVISMSSQSEKSDINNTDLCTLYIDMTYDDRIFFGVHNFYQLKRSLLETQCNIDFSAPDNKVSIIGKVPNVQKMCEMFIAHSTLALQFEFKFYDEKYLDYMRTTFALFHQQCELYHKVFVTYRRSKSNAILFNFLSFRSNGLGLIRAMIQLKNELEYCQVGEFLPNITSTMQIPCNRRDLTGRGNSYIEQIQNKTQTKIEVIRYEDCPQYQFENVLITGQTIPSVIQARFELASRFTFELKFQVSINETRSLVDYISKLSYDLKSIFISIEPCNQIGPNSKIIAINGNEKSIGKLFTLRDQLIAELYKSDPNTMKKLLT